MGDGRYDYVSSATRAAARTKSGLTGFAFDTAVRTGVVSDPLHPSLDLKKKPRREARDNPDNPTSTPLAVVCDVTGSMQSIPKLVLKDLNKLMKMILERKVIEYPQILFGAVGDATVDQAPIAMGEFEADDEKAEEHLTNIYLEGGGGSGEMESYELAMWFFANQVATDAWEKRGQKGYLFFIGDEAPYPTVSAALVKDHMGGGLQENVPTKEIASTLQERWNVFCLRPGRTSNFDNARVHSVWTELLPTQHVLRVENWEDIVPYIAATVNVMEGETISDTRTALADGGFDSKVTDKIGTALAPLAASIVPTITGGDITGTDTAHGVSL